MIYPKFFLNQSYTTEHIQNFHLYLLLKLLRALFLNKCNNNVIILVQNQGFLFKKKL